MAKATLVLVRHGQSTWNAKNLFTGWRNPHLTVQGAQEAKNTGRLLRTAGLTFDKVHTSALKRAQQTTHIILATLGRHKNVKVAQTKALNERHYGNLAGLNKDKARQKWGPDKVHQWRRSFAIAPPNGESLKDTAARVLAYYDTVLLPQLQQGHNLLVVAHGNSLRALVMHLNKLTPQQIVKVNIATGQPLCYHISKQGRATAIKLAPSTV